MFSSTGLRASLNFPLQSLSLNARWKRYESPSSPSSARHSTASGVENASPGSSVQPKPSGLMPARSRAAPYCVPSTDAVNEPEYTSTSPNASPAVSQVSRFVSIRKGLWTCEDAPRLL